ncbi:MAG TPA: DUF2911 domain-containing protein [Vicinamibacterales bacterium]|jgi:hypothetical protein|nr:DUF2911 domain-containing protein [Vicinamibacterales bacterium]
MTAKAFVTFATVFALTVCVLAQGRRPASPDGSASTEIAGHYTKGSDEPVYQGGKWIEITYGRPIKRGRDLWGSGADYGKQLYQGAPIWRAGANVTTRLKTELPLTIDGKRIAAGEYDIFIDLKPNNWTFVLSTWPIQSRFDQSNSNAVFGSIGYTPDKDVLRAPMKLETLQHSYDQLTWEFLDMSDTGGTMALMWDKTMATVGFKVGS